MTVATGAGSFDRWASRVAALGGWRRYGAAAGLGLLAVLALPPFHAVPLLAVACTGLLWLVDGAPTRRAAFLTGWWFGFGHFVGGLYWITNALLVDAAKFGWLAPFAVSGLSVYFALYPGLVALVWRELRRRGRLAGWAGPLAFGALWAAGEWLRGHVLTGFPWNLFGTVWAFSPWTLQAASLIGAYGLSLLTAAAAAAPAALASRPFAGRPWRGVGALVGLLVLALAYGPWRLAGAEDTDVADVRLRIVQANIDQRLKWQDDERLRTLRKYFELSALPAPAPISHVIWPETAVPYLMANEPAILAAFGDFVGRHLAPGGLAITGAPRATPPGVQPFQVWNSLHAIGAEGRILATYDKHHLVPFGEYVPLRGWLPIDKITPGAVDFSAGPGPRTLALPGLPPVSPLICYETIFPGNVTGATRPHWLLNVTNDAWFGHSTGPYQHLASARLRAVEEGLPMARAANTGISAIFDAYGRERGRIGLGRDGVLDSGLPAALAPTLYGRIGDAAFLALLVLAALAVAARRR